LRREQAPALQCGERQRRVHVSDGTGNPSPADWSQISVSLRGGAVMPRRRGNPYPRPTRILCVTAGRETRPPMTSPGRLWGAVLVLFSCRGGVSPPAMGAQQYRAGDRRSPLQLLTEVRCRARRPRRAAMLQRVLGGRMWASAPTGWSQISVSLREGAIMPRRRGNP